MKNPPAFWVWMQDCTNSHAKGIEIEIAETRGHQKTGVSILSSIWCFDVSDGGNKARYSLQCRGQMDSLMTWSRSLESPSAEDDVRIKRVFRYIAGPLILQSPTRQLVQVECWNATVMLISVDVQKLEDQHLVY
ncbi:hypothetical protein AVEN_233880-1 [Araneus ventricosus]|uniref:Uncharacterized protein n=1 Tax=Araneus ventricosus TaxID=182803 RepID=A0A4Y2HXH4_ARAVE|nr:hypothetical protein AVEN_233880-1 [Araneus ventricosus]